MSLLRRAWRRRPLLPRRLRVALALALAAAAIASMAGSQGAGGQGGGELPPDPGQLTTEDEPDPGGEVPGEEVFEPGVQVPPGLTRKEMVEQGRRLFLEGCSDCHGRDANGIPERAPTLRGVGALAADFYLRTGRMPLGDPEQQPRRSESPFTEEQVDALIAYVDTLGGPPVPEVDADRGSVAEGLALFTDNCAGCHQIAGQGGITTGAVVPDLQVSEPIDVAEAVRIGPFVMPHFPGLSDEDVDDIAAYVRFTQDPEDVGGWGIGHIGPVPEGMVTWLLALASLVFVIRLIGERTTP